jgi:hypothetical protein
MGICNCVTPRYPCTACGAGYPASYNYFTTTGRWVTCNCCGGAGEVWEPAGIVQPKWTITTDKSSNTTTPEVDKADEPW